MERYVLDTDTINHLVSNNDKGKEIRSRLSSVSLEELNVTCISKAESDRWFKRIKKIESNNLKNKLYNTQALFRHINVLNMTDDLRLFIMEYREKYSYLKWQIDLCDFIIWCITIFYWYTLITCNEKHFSRMPDLKYQNYSK